MTFSERNERLAGFLLREARRRSWAIPWVVIRPILAALLPWLIEAIFSIGLYDEDGLDNRAAVDRRRSIRAGSDIDMLERWRLELER